MTAPRSKATSRKSTEPANDDVQQPVDTQYLETLLGYNARRAALSIIGGFMHRMADFDLRPVDFSVLSLIGRNPGITSRQLCHSLNILPPNLVGLLKALEKRQLIVRTPHPTDGRALGLSLTPEGVKLAEKAEAMATRSDHLETEALTDNERKTLTRLLKKIYLSGSAQKTDRE